MADNLRGGHVPEELLLSGNSALEWLRSYGEPISVFRDTSEILNNQTGHISQGQTIQYPLITYLAEADGTPTETVHSVEFKPIRTGLSITLVPTITDSRFFLSLDFNINWLDSYNPGDPQHLVTPEPARYQIRQTSTLAFRDGQTRALFHSSEQEGRSFLLLLTGRLTHPSGGIATLGDHKQPKQE